MIKNEREFRITRRQAVRLEQALMGLGNSDTDDRLHPLLKNAQRESLQSQLDDLRQELAEYEGGAANPGIRENLPWSRMRR